MLQKISQESIKLQKSVQKRENLPMLCFTQVKEDNGKWRDFRLLRSKKNIDDVVLFFGKSEYEGLNGGYRYELKGDKMVLTDPDHELIETRPNPRREDRNNKLSKDARREHNRISLEKKKDRKFGKPPPPKNVFQEGSRVEARWNRGNLYYLALITRVRDNGKSFDLRYDDGFIEQALPKRFLRVHSPSRAQRYMHAQDAMGDNAKPKSSSSGRNEKNRFSKHPALTWTPEKQKWKVAILSNDNCVEEIGFYKTEKRAVAAYGKAKAKRISEKHNVAADPPSSKQTTITKQAVDFNKREYTREKKFKDKIQV